jgi:hypothetical protein
VKRSRAATAIRFRPGRFESEVVCVWDEDGREAAAWGRELARASRPHRGRSGRERSASDPRPPPAKHGVYADTGVGSEEP